MYWKDLDCTTAEQRWQCLQVVIKPTDGLARPPSFRVEVAQPWLVRVAAEETPVLWARVVERGSGAWVLAAETHPSQRGHVRPVRTSSAAERTRPRSRRTAAPSFRRTTTSS